MCNQNTALIMCIYPKYNVKLNVQVTLSLYSHCLDTVVKLSGYVNTKTLYEYLRSIIVWLHNLMYWI